MKMYFRALVLFGIGIASPPVCFAQSGWMPQSSGTTYAFRGVSFVDANNGWAVGSYELSSSTTDGGATWMTSCCRSYGLFAHTVAALDKNQRVVAGQNVLFRPTGAIAATTDGAATWRGYDQGLPFMDFLGAAYPDTNTPIAVGYFLNHALIMISTDGGDTWRGAPIYGRDPSQLRGVSFADANNGIAVGDGILWTKNGGLTWTVRSVSGGLWAVSLVDANTGTAVGEGGTIVRTTNGGETWTRQDSGTSNTLYGVKFVDANTGWAVGAFGTILRTTDGGNSWVTQVSGTTSWLFAVSFVDALTGWVVGGDGTILSTITGGD